MNINPFNEFKFIHDNKPDIRYAICRFLYGGTYALAIDYLIDAVSECGEEEFKKLIKFNNKLYMDYDVDEICIKTINYSDLIQSDGIVSLYGPSEVWACGSFIIDFHK